ILPVPYEETATYGKGTQYAPAAIIAASQEVELFDDELGCEPYLAGIHTAPSVEITSGGAKVQNEIVYKSCRELVQQGKVVGMLGGEHSISFGAVRACLEKYPDLTVLQLDAHADLRDGYLGEPFSHAAVMRRIRELTKKTFGVGIRNYSSEENDYIKAEQVSSCSARNAYRNPRWVDEVVEQLSGDVYLTFDLDAFDPSLLPATGTPEPGGLMWYPVLELLRRVITKCRLVSFDVVELSPIEGNHASDFVAAKLTHKIIGYDSQKRLLQ
ncbi:MAG: agmatinase, partial [Candidatus Zixiibacteriota bacterium]